MTDAPERIWVTGRFDLGASSNGSWNAHKISSKRADYGEQEYTRSDLIPALVAAAEERGRIAGLREAAEMLKFRGKALAYLKRFDVAEAIDRAISAILARIPATQSDADHASRPVAPALQPGEASASSAPATQSDEAPK